MVATSFCLVLSRVGFIGIDVYICFASCTSREDSSAIEFKELEITLVNILYVLVDKIQLSIFLLGTFTFLI